MSLCTTTKITGTVLPAIGSAVTAVRLSYRWHRRQLGWDDAWAFVALVPAAFLAVGVWFRCGEPGSRQFEQPSYMRVVGYYMAAMGFTCTVWAVRLSLLTSIIRITPSMMRIRVWAKHLVILFILFWSSLVILKVATCEHDTSWKHQFHIRCPLSRSIAIYEIIIDCIADVTLAVLPLRLLWQTTSLPRKQRRLLTLIFSSSLLITSAGIVHEIFVYRSMQDWITLMTQVEATTALIVCNLAVLVTWMVRLCGLVDSADELDSVDTVISLEFSKSRQTGELSSLRFQKVSLCPQGVDITSDRASTSIELPTTPQSAVILGQSERRVIMLH